MKYIEFLATIIATWFFTYLYYERSNRELKKIPKEIRKALKEDFREKLSVKELT